MVKRKSIEQEFGFTKNVYNLKEDRLSKLFDNGKFEMRNIPNPWTALSDADPNVQTEFDAFGTWTISDKGSIYVNEPIYVILLSFDSISLDSVDLSDSQVYFDGKIPLYFRGHISPYILKARGFGTNIPSMSFVIE